MIAQGLPLAPMIALVLHSRFFRYHYHGLIRSILGLGSLSAWKHTCAPPPGFGAQNEVAEDVRVVDWSGSVDQGLVCRYRIGELCVVLQDNTAVSNVSKSLRVGEMTPSGWPVGWLAYF